MIRFTIIFSLVAVVCSCAQKDTDQRQPIDVPQQYVGSASLCTDYSPSTQRITRELLEAIPEGDTLNLVVSDSSENAGAMLRATRDGFVLGDYDPSMGDNPERSYLLQETKDGRTWFEGPMFGKKPLTAPERGGQEYRAMMDSLFRYVLSTMPSADSTHRQ